MLRCLNYLLGFLIVAAMSGCERKRSDVAFLQPITSSGASS